MEYIMMDLGVVANIGVLNTIIIVLDQTFLIMAAIHPNLKDKHMLHNCTLTPTSAKMVWGTGKDVIFGSNTAGKVIVRHIYLVLA